MDIYAHRGNLLGPSEDENDPEIIFQRSKRFNVEVDVWKLGPKIFFGHDRPTYEVPLDKINLHRHKLLLHAKNLDALEYFTFMKYHVFWHQKDDFTLSSCGCIITYPGQPVTYSSIVMEPERYTIDTLKYVVGICTDYPLLWEELLCK